MNIDMIESNKKIYICPKREECSEECSHKEPHEADNWCYEEECEIMSGVNCELWDGRGDYNYMVRCEAWNTCDFERSCGHKDWHIEYDECCSDPCSPEEDRNYKCISKKYLIIDVDELFEDIDV